MRARQGAVLTRALTAAVLLALWLTVIWAPALRLVFVGMVAAAAGLGAVEYYGMVRARGIPAEAATGACGAIAVAASATVDSPVVTAVALFGCCGLVCIGAVLRQHGSLAGMACGVFGVVYAGWFPAHVVFLHGRPGTGPTLVTLLVAAIALTDSAGYVVGSAFGRRKMAPAISPNKTWEGAGAGLAAAVAFMTAAALYRRHTGWAGLPDWTVWNYALTGAALSVVGQLGDLVESALKRDAGVKDAGSVFPGHGGALDRFDSLLFAAPALYGLVVLWE